MASITGDTKRNDSVTITGIWLRKAGGENDPKARVQVLVEIGGIWKTVVSENAYGAFSHIVEPSGIRKPFESATLSEPIDDATKR